MKYAFNATLLIAFLSLGAATTEAQVIEDPKIGIYFSKPLVQSLKDGDDSTNPFMRLDLVSGNRVPIPASASTGARFRVANFNGGGSNLATTTNIENNTRRWNGRSGGINNGGVYTASGRAFRRTADQYGGEDPPANNEAYLALFGPSGGVSAGQVDIDFSANPLSYFGFYWSAGSNQNRVDIYGANDTLLDTFYTSDLINILGPNVNPPNPAAKKVVTLGNTEYNGSEYYGKPPGRTQNTDEPYAFIHFLANGAEYQIYRLVFSNTVSGPAFESDNHTTAFWSETGQIYMPIDTDELIRVKPIPEPSTYVLLGAAALLGAWLRRHKRRIA